MAQCRSRRSPSSWRWTVRRSPETSVRSKPEGSQHEATRVGAVAKVWRSPRRGGRDCNRGYRSGDPRRVRCCEGSDPRAGRVCRPAWTSLPASGDPRCSTSVSDRMANLRSQEARHDLARSKNFLRRLMYMHDSLRRPGPPISNGGSSMKLFGTYFSPFTRRVAVALTSRGIPYEHDDLNGYVDPARARALNPVGKVPVLVLDDGEHLIDSTAILDYLAERVGHGQALVPHSGRERRAALRLAAIATTIYEQSTARYFEERRPGGCAQPELLERYRLQTV